MGREHEAVRVLHEQRLRREVLVGPRELALLHLRRALGHEEGLADRRVVRRLGPRRRRRRALGFLSAAEAIMLVTSLMPDSRAAIFYGRGSAGGGAVGEALGWRCVVCGAPGERRASRGGARRRRAAVGASWDRRHRRVCGVSWGRRGLGGRARAPGEWGVRPVRTRRGPQTAAPGPRSGQRAARGCRATFDHATTPQMPQQRREPLVPRLTDSAVARLLWATTEQRERRTVSATSSEGVYGVISVTKTQRPTMGNARLAKLNDRVEKTGSGFARGRQNSRSFPHQGLPTPKVPGPLWRKKPRFHKNSKTPCTRTTYSLYKTQHITQAGRSPLRARRPPPAPPHRTPRRPTSPYTPSRASARRREPRAPNERLALRVGPDDAVEPRAPRGPARQYAWPSAFERAMSLIDFRGPPSRRRARPPSRSRPQAIVPPASPSAAAGAVAGVRVRLESHQIGEGELVGERGQRFDASSAQRRTAPSTASVRATSAQLLQFRSASAALNSRGVSKEWKRSPIQGARAAPSRRRAPGGRP